MRDSITILEQEHPQAAALREGIKDLITKATSEKYISTSSHMDYKTGNRYQSLDLGDSVIGGFRSVRTQLFEAFDFNGKTVLDCGCNLGEMSRMARRRGATLVDGIEYDPLFVATGRLVNALNGISRVSLVQGDLTQRETISGSYDITLAFSVFPYISPVLDRVESATREMLILETHNISDQLFARYVEPLSKYFPFHTYVARTDFGGGQSHRAVIAFAKKQQTLTPAGGILRSTIDVAGSKFGFTDAFMAYAAKATGGRGVKTVEDLARVVEYGNVPDDEVKLTAGVTYWAQLLRGFLEYRNTGSITPNNSFALHLRRMLEQLNFDPLLASALRSENALLERVARRFTDATAIFAEPALPKVAAVKFFNPDPESGHLFIRRPHFDETVRCNQMDGFHRVFWAVLSGANELPALFPYQQAKRRASVDGEKTR